MYRLPESLRARFRDPFGPVYPTEEIKQRIQPGERVVAIGDMVAQTAIDLGLQPKVIIVDFKTQRGPIDPKSLQTLRGYGQSVLRVKNPAATVTGELFSAVGEALRLSGPVRIEVDGEEDLAGLPVFAQAPDGYVVLYGLPNRGIVLVRMDEMMRRMSREFLDQMRA